jgi:hypothetical protein
VPSGFSASQWMSYGASSAGTGEVIADRYPEVTALHGDELAVHNGECDAPSPPPSPPTTICARMLAKPTKEAVPIPELVKDQNDAALVARR